MPITRVQLSEECLAARTGVRGLIVGKAIGLLGVKAAGIGVPSYIDASIGSHQPMGLATG